MTRIRDLVEGEVIDAADLPVEIDLEEWPQVEYQLAIVEGVEKDRAPGSSKFVVHTREHGSWAVDPDFEIQVRSQVRR